MKPTIDWVQTGRQFEPPDDSFYKGRIKVVKLPDETGFIWYHLFVRLNGKWSGSIADSVLPSIGYAIDMYHLTTKTVAFNPVILNGLKIVEADHE